jgi:glycosyltransferase involved in cell wall biosynthesis
MISLITVTLNEEKKIICLIESIKRQSSKKFEWIVVDGGSDDNTINLLKKSNVNQLKLYISKDLGLYESVNFALSKLKTEYYVLLGADDYIFNNSVEDFNNAVIIRKEKLIYFNIIIEGKIRKPHYNKLLYGKFLLPSSHSIGTLINVNLHKNNNFYDKDFRIAADYKFLLEVLKFEKPFYIDKTVGIFSLTGISNRNLTRSLVEFFLIKVTNGSLSFYQIILLTTRLLYLLINEKINHNNRNKKIK